MDVPCTLPTPAFKVRYMARGIPTTYGAVDAPPCSLATALGLLRYLKRRGYTAWVVDAHTMRHYPVRGAMKNLEPVEPM